MYFCNKCLFVFLLLTSLLSCKNEQIVNVQEVKSIERGEEEIVIDENCKITFKHKFKTPKLIKETADYIYLKSVWATPSAMNCRPLIYQFWLLPINKDKAIYTKIGFIELIGDNLIFNEDGKSLMIKNIKTQKEQIIKLKPTPYIESKELENSINTINISKNILKIRYLTGTHDNYEFTTETFELK